jgi:hypothetical protein
VPGLMEALHQVMEVEGVLTVALIDIATGMVVRSVGEAREEGADFPAAAASLADEARIACAALGPDSNGGDLAEISLVTANRLQVSKVLDSRLGQGCLLFVDLDRSRVNFALASLRIGQLAPAILGSP